jgi:steroid 5-alpha reductase family enzyme
LLLVLAVMAAARNPFPLGWSDLLGAVIGAAAIAGEALSDAQMRAFKRDPGNKGRICDTGLWGLSRHPNYFFEWLAWLAYLPIGIHLAGGYPWGWATLIAPLLMYWLLVRVSGIPPLEAHMLRSRPEAFRAYQARVRAFWPIPRFH